MKLLELDRLGCKGSSTIGVLHWIENGKRIHEAFVLEDEARSQKLAGETRIPAGKYEIKLREEPSPLTQKYRQKYDWFKWHLQIQNVPNFKNVYIHIGNYETNTDGCLLVGQNPAIKGQEYAIWNSLDAFKPFYLKMVKLLKSEKVFIEIKDFCKQDDYEYNPII